MSLLKIIVILMFWYKSKMSLNKFPCSGCGACCRRINKAVENLSDFTKDKDSDFYFPYKWDENGVCENLIDNKCLIYEDRPLICNIDKLLSLTNIPRKKFYKMNIVECNKMMDEDNLPNELRIK